MSISMLFEQINDIKQLFSETSKQLENEKLKTDQIRESISAAERDGQNYSEINSELTNEIARITRITQERQFSVEFNQQKRETLLKKVAKIKEEISNLQTKRDTDRSLFEKKIEEFNVDVEDEPTVVEQKIERTIVNVEGELLRAKKKLDALKETVAAKRKKSEDMNSINALKNTLRDKQIEKQTQTEALMALERQINDIKKQRDDITSSRLVEAVESKKDLSDYCTALKRQLEDVRLTKQELLRQLERKKSARLTQEMPKENHQMEPHNELEPDDETLYDEFFAATQVK